MLSETFTLNNREGEYMTALVERDDLLDLSGLVFVAHGLGGWKDQSLIQSVAEAFLKQGFRVVRYDATNSIGEAGGKFENASATSFLHDLEDVLAWATDKEWYQEPFVLAGHSLGAMAAALYAEKHPEKVKALCLVAAVVSGKMSFSSERYKEKMREWQERGWIEMRDIRNPGARQRLQWTHVEDRLRCDLLPEANRLTMPTLLVVGDRDNGTPPEHQEVLFEALSDPKELIIIPDAGHTFSEETSLFRLKEAISGWIERGREEAWERIKSRLTRSS